MNLLDLIRDVTFTELEIVELDQLTLEETIVELEGTDNV